MTETTHNPFNEAHRVSCLRENLTSSSDGEGLETGCALSSVPRQSFTRQTYFDRVKNIFELERFSGTTLTAIEQDFYGVIFLASLESVLTKPAQAVLATQSQHRECHTKLHFKK